MIPDVSGETGIPRMQPAFIVTIFLACVIWGLKLEWRIEHQTAMIREAELMTRDLKHVVDQGILPLTAERLQRLGQALNKLDEDHVRMKKDIERLDMILEHLTSRR